MGKRGGNRGGKRGSRSSIAPQTEPEDVLDYTEGSSEVSYGHAIALEPPEADPTVEILGGRHGADMPEILECATWVMREQVLSYWKKIQVGPLSARERGEFNQLVDALGKLDRSVRQWRRLQAEELGALTEPQLLELLPIAAAALGLTAPPIDVEEEE